MAHPDPYLNYHHDPAYVSAHYTAQTGFESNEPHKNNHDGQGNAVYFRPLASWTAATAEMPPVLPVHGMETGR
ncbi:MAG: hypothetical protein LAO76_26440 [Acidobacteriia bacterium]|nr:hypothetical protein [Terriglobia bacterium]